MGRVNVAAVDVSTGHSCYGEPGAQENDVGARPMRRVTVE